jgi:uncharacterized membrane protein YphA (DoxX/SURF4 family)
MLARQIAIGFGIAVIFPLLVYYGVATFDPPPHMESITMPTVMPNPTPEERLAYQQARKAFDEQFKRARDEYLAAEKAFVRILILVSTPLGVAAILIGAFTRLHSIGTGLILGGIATVGFGYWNYWQFLADWMRFVSLLAGFAILVFVAYRQFAVTRGSPASSG